MALMAAQKVVRAAPTASPPLTPGTRQPLTLSLAAQVIYDLAFLKEYCSKSFYVQ